jgi:protein SCO1/2
MQGKANLVRAGVIVVLAAVTLAALVGGCGSSSNGGKVNAPHYDAVSVAKPPKPAPPLALRDSLGHPVDLRQFRGKAVVVTFIYTHCPDVCPLIVSHLKTVQSQLGPQARKLQIVAVSTDPRGDTPPTVAAFLRNHAMTGKMEYLIGSPSELQRTWKDWNIVAKPSKANPDRVEHSALVYGIDAQGKLTTLYPADFKPAQVAHDVPLLAAQ